MTEKNISDRKITLQGTNLSTLKTREERMFFKKNWIAIVFIRAINKYR